MSETLILAALVIPALVVAIVFHEVSHGYAALALGDTTARDRNRLSLNPVRHVDPIGTIVVPLGLWLVGGPIFGWAKPVPVLKNRLDNPRYGMMAVAAAGPLSNIVLATLGAVVVGILFGTAEAPTAGVSGWIVQALSVFILVNVFLALFNLLPIPPFDGSHIVQGLLPPRFARYYGQFQKFGVLFIVALVGSTWLFPDSGIIARFVLPPVEWSLSIFRNIANFVESLF